MSRKDVSHDMERTPTEFVNHPHIHVLGDEDYSALIVIVEVRLKRLVGRRAQSRFGGRMRFDAVNAAPESRRSATVAANERISRFRCCKDPCGARLGHTARYICCNARKSSPQAFYFICFPLHLASLLGMEYDFITRGLSACCAVHHERNECLDLMPLAMIAQWTPSFPAIPKAIFLVSLG